MSPRIATCLVVLVAISVTPALAHARGCSETGTMVGYRRCYSLQYDDASNTPRMIIGAFTFYNSMEPGTSFVGNAQTLSLSQRYAFDPTARGQQPLHFAGAGFRVGGYLWRGLSIVTEVRAAGSAAVPAYEYPTPLLRVQGADQAGYVAAAAYLGYSVRFGRLALRAEVGAGLREAWVNTLVHYGEELGTSDVHALNGFGAARLTADVFLFPNASLSVGAECDFFLSQAYSVSAGFVYHTRSFDSLP